MSDMRFDLLGLTEAIRALKLLLITLFERLTLIRRRQSYRREIDEYVRKLTADSNGSNAIEDSGHARHFIVDVMSYELERSLLAATLALVIALLLVGGCAWYYHSHDMIVAAFLVGGLFIVALARQALLAWRCRRGLFGSSEHEVRQLLLFALRHETPDDFFDDNGRLLPAFDVASRQADTPGFVRPKVEPA